MEFPANHPAQRINNRFTPQHFYWVFALVSRLVLYTDLGLPNSLLDGAASSPSDLFNVSRYSNSADGPLNGVETNMQAPLTFLPGFWANFGVQAKYTFVTSKINYVLQSANGVPTLTTTNDLLMLSPHSASGVI